MSSASVVRQVAGAGATQYGIVNGAVYNIYQAGSGTSDAPIDLQLYLDGLLSRPAFNQKFIPLDIEPFVFIAGQGFRSQGEAATPLLASIDAHRRLLLLGNAGAGKTASMRHIAAMLSRRQPAGLPDGLAGVTPIYVELSRFRAIPGMTPLTSILALIGELLHVALMVEQVPSERAVHKLLMSERLILLLDGLNEVAPDSREACVRGIEDLAAKYGGIRIVVGTRFHRAEELADWEAVALQELQGPQILEFLRQHLGATQSEQIAGQIIASHLALLCLPLFLKLIVDLTRASSGTQSFVNGSRSFIVARYARYLLTRDTVGGITRSGEPRASPAEMEATLMTLGNVCHCVGQSIPLVDACRLTSEGGGIAEPRVAQILAQLCQMGMLFQDGEYIRFWHQTLQDYYYSLHLYRSGLAGAPGGLSAAMKETLRASKEDEGCAYLIAHTESDAVLGELLGYAAIKNAALCFAWIDDLRYEGRAEGVVTRTLETLRKRALRSRRYSRISGRRGVMTRLAVYPFVLLAPLLVTMVLALDGTSIPAAAVLTAWGVCMLDVLASYGGTADLLQLGLATTGIRRADTKQDVGRVAAVLSSSLLSSGAVRRIARQVIGSDSGEGALDRLMATSPVYVAIPVLAHLDDDRVPGLLRRLVDLNNSCSCEAVKCLDVRHGRFPRERQEIVALLRHVFENTRPRWKLWRLAREQLEKRGERPAGRGHILIRGARSLALGATGLVLNTVIETALIAAFSQLDTTLLGGQFTSFTPQVTGALVLVMLILAVVPFLSLLLAVVLCIPNFMVVAPISVVGFLITVAWLPLLIWVDMRRMRARGVPGCHALAGLAPWRAALLALCWPAYMAFRYPIVRHVVRRNAVPVRWETLAAR